jgi:alkanesulfonate monooxygenase SsuD/methylene tetrahydromethanopterin reductase-like flavin-dependent oxidoreductase (luciferase family)
MGGDGLWVGDRSSTPYWTHADAVAAAVTERVQIGTNVLNASVVHAEELAERILGLARRPAQ